MAARKKLKPEADLLKLTPEDWEECRRHNIAKYIELRLKEASLRASLKVPDPLDPSSVQTYQEIGKALLASIGYNDACVDAVTEAVAANETFVATLDAIKDKYCDDADGADDRPRGRVDERKRMLTDLGHA